ncbi:MAG: T9SS type A sorting domain-containing protein [Crocinitomicaceae bacterium]|nr:T9SS type A sorting domain-containing protein [Crocinitomicaceae bacterium]
MKTILAVVAFAIVTFSADAQVNTELRIYHMLGTQAFQMSTTAQNNMGDDFQVERLQYYMSNFSIVHDGGMETAVSSDTVALMNAADGNFSVVELGSHSITNVEGVKFHIGVPQPTNNEDPSLYGPDHPFTPQSPSMHWGWASGYRFLAYEGTGGMNFSQTFQMHGLGNNNYFQTSVTATGQMVNGNLVIALDADYVRGVDNINVSNGVIAHGVDQEDLTALENFRDFVFSSSSQDLTASQEELENVNWTVYPNPSSENINIAVDSEMEIDGIRINNALGQEVAITEVIDAITSIELDEAGIYFVSLMKDGVALTTKQIVKQ